MSPATKPAAPRAPATADTARMADNAAEAARFLRALAHDGRLMVLCSLAEGECSVAELQRLVPLSQSALSQHLAMLRREGLVATRRESQRIHYRLSDERVRRVVPLLYELFCDEA